MSNSSINQKYILLFIFYVYAVISMPTVCSAWSLNISTKSTTTKVINIQTDKFVHSFKSHIVS